jgi:hypothetical protein
VLAWGNNQSGELGDGTAPTDHSTPVVVKGLGPGSGVVSIAAGLADSYALRGDGSVLAWGNNQRGETGSGDAPTEHSTPVGVTGATGVVAIAAGWSHALALEGNGAVLAWGDNALGQLGDGSTQPRSAPVVVAGFGPGSHAVAVFAGGNDSHALVGVPMPGPTTPSAPTGGGGRAAGGGTGGAGSSAALGGVGTGGSSGKSRRGATKPRAAPTSGVVALFAAQAVAGGDPYGTPPTTKTEQRDCARAALAMRALPGLRTRATARRGRSAG